MLQREIAFLIDFSGRESSLEHIGTFDIQKIHVSDNSLSIEEGLGVPNGISNTQTIMELESVLGQAYI